jgi:hypothetical protein
MLRGILTAVSVRISSLWHSKARLIISASGATLRHSGLVQALGQGEVYNEWFCKGAHSSIVSYQRGRRTALTPEKCCFKDLELAQLEFV